MSGANVARPWLLGLSRSALWTGLSLGACQHSHRGYDHAEEHAEGHDHHAEGHGHDDPMLRITAWSPEFELFAEHPPLVSGKPSAWLVHVTVLAEFRPLENAELRLELTGPTTLQAVAGPALRPGAYPLQLPGPAPGAYQARLVIQGPISGSIEGLNLRVFESAEAGSAAGLEPGHDGLIELLKEQQWGIPFATRFAAQGSLLEALTVSGTVDTPPGGSAVVGAPVAGRLIAPATGLGRPGDRIRKGQLLASLSPAPAAPEDAARASLAVAEAEARQEGARTALERAQRLMNDDAIARRELEEAQREARVAEQTVRAAHQARELFAGASAGSGAGSWQLLAPIAGVLTQVRATPGASVSPADTLFEIVDGSELWLRARVAEQDASRLRSDRDASYQVAGLDTWHALDLSGDGANAQLVNVGRTVDPRSRTVDVIYSLRVPLPELRVGGRVQLSLPTGDDFSGVVVPTSALVDDDGRWVVYVQVDGEHFAERQVSVGPRAGDRVGIVRGLQSGERVVVVGAHVLRLVDRQSSGTPHGHIH